MPLCLQLFAMVTNGTGGNSFTLVSNTWFDIIKTKQTKLPESITDGATIDSKSKVLNPQSLDTTKPKRKKIKLEENQTRLDLTEE